MTAACEKIQRLNVLGVGISIIDLPSAVSVIQDWVTKGTKSYICVTGVHGVMESQKDTRLRAIHNQSGMTVPDGMPMVWAGKIYGFKNIARVYGPDLMLAICRTSVRKKFTHFLYGGNQGVAERLKEYLQNKFPGISIVGTYTPPFRLLNEKERQDLIRQVAACRPDLFWVGLSTPKQERFMSQYLRQLETKVMLGVGAAFDIHAGLFNDAPDWIKKCGMQWFYRLCQNPRRLWRRYLTHNPVFGYRFLQQLLKDKFKGDI